MALGEYDIKDWNPSSQHVYKDANLSSRNFLSSDDVVVLSGGISNSKFSNLADNSRLAATGTAAKGLRFIGLVQTFNIQSTKSIMPLYELGSSLAYWITAQVTQAANISVVTFKGPSLISRIYHDVDVDSAGFKLARDGKSNFYPSVSGTEGFFGINMDDENLEQTVGLAVLFRFSYKDEGGTVRKAIAGWYLEECFVQTGALAVNVGTTLMMETTPIYVDKIVPFYVSITGSGGAIAI